MQNCSFPFVFTVAHILIYYFFHNAFSPLAIVTFVTHIFQSGFLMLGALCLHAVLMAMLFRPLFLHYKFMGRKRYEFIISLISPICQHHLLYCLHSVLMAMLFRPLFLHYKFMGRKRYEFIISLISPICQHHLLYCLHSVLMAMLFRPLFLHYKLFMGRKRFKLANLLN